MNGYSKGFRYLVMGVLATLFLTGCLLVPTMLDLKLYWDMPWRLPGSGRIGVAALHVGAAFIMATFFGALWMAHMRSNWRRRRNRAGGALLAALLVTLTLTGLGIYYFGNEDLSLWSSLSHTIVGLAIPVLFGHHIYASRTLAARSARPDRRYRPSAEDGDMAPVPLDLRDIEIRPEETLH